MASQTISPDQTRTYPENVIAEFRASGGTGRGPLAGEPLLLLTTTGARSGQPHVTPLTYTRDGSRLVVIAAEQGAPAHPDWYHNIAANPNVTVEIGDETFRAVAQIAEGAKRQRLLDHLVEQRPTFSEFQLRTPRELPVIVLERVLDNMTDYQAFNRDFIAEFRANGGKVGGIFEGLSVLLLTTTGAKSGEPRIAPVLYGIDQGRLVIVASKGGSPTHPDWYYNIVANPEVAVEVGPESFPARASFADGAERQRLFDQLLAVIPKLKETQESTSRQIPIVVLERAS
jgi:deazaflavin-dependent oxidoreductase (nitroreductase family)